MLEIMQELHGWIESERDTLSAQHSKLAEDRLIVQGRYEACQIIVNKIAELQAKAAEAPSEAPTEDK